MSAQSEIHWDRTGNGFWHTASNWDLNRIPNAMDTVYIEHDSVLIGNGIVAEAGRVIVGASSVSGVGLAVFDTGKLIVTPATKQTTAIELIESSLFNIGLIKISNHITGIHIDKESRLINQDSIVLNGCNVGISNFNQLDNQEAGYIYLLAGWSGNGAIENFDSIENSGIIDLYGRVSVNSMGYLGDTASHFDNSGYLESIESARSLELRSGTITNTGFLNCEGLDFGLVMDEHSSFANGGKFLIPGGNNGVDSEGLLINTDTIIVENTGSSLTFTGPAGKLLNESLGVIKIGDQYAGNGLNLFTGSTSENFGLLEIYSVTDVGINLWSAFVSGSMVNYGTITIDSCAIGLKSLNTRYSVINLGGQISITNFDLGIDMGGNLINELSGSIHLNSGIDGYLVQYTGSLTNKINSNIQTENITGIPLNVRRLTEFTNDGILQIEN